jgi:ribonuclease-3
MSDASLGALMDKLGHHFADEKLLVQALTHKSAAAASNERLEFLGDAILNLTVAEMLYQRFPSLNEGELTRVRAGMVCHDALVNVAQQLGIAPLLRIDRNSRLHNARDTLLSDAVEALFAAVRLDAGLAVAQKVIAYHMNQLLLRGEAKLEKDPKMALQERLQARGIAPPRYILQEEGAPFAREFKVRCTIPEWRIDTMGIGPTRKAAERRAATLALAGCPR